MKRINFQLVAAFVAVVMLTISCRKNQDKNDGAEIAQQSSLAQKSMSSLGVMANEAIAGAFVSYSASCVTLSYDTTGVSKTITIDFGSTACACADGKERKGKVFVTTNGVFGSIGDANKTVITTENYYVNDNLIKGTRTVTRTSATETSLVSESTVTLPDDLGSFTWNGNFKSKYVSGDNTPYLADDEYTLTGDADGVNTKDIAYVITVTEPLMVQTGCQWIKGGIISITADNMKEAATMEYGDGYCDNVVLLKYKNKEKELRL